MPVGELCIGWTADSGYAPRLMDALSVKCQLLIVDARKAAWYSVRLGG